MKLGLSLVLNLYISMALMNLQFIIKELEFIICSHAIVIHHLQSSLKLNFEPIVIPSSVTDETDFTELQCM